MKKNLFYLFALICTMSLFTACSDDDDTSWKEIPQDEITVGTDGVTLSVNGVAASTGSVQMTVNNGSTAVLNLNNVIPGYAKVPVDVELQKQPDGSFNFAGEAGLTTPPSMKTKAAANAPVIFKVDAQGNISKDGKTAVTITTELSEEAQGGLAGTWNLLSELPTAEDMTVLNSPLWITWSAIDPAKTNMESGVYLINVLGGAMVYNLLGNVTFNADGNVTANYNNTNPLGMETMMEYMEAMKEKEDGSYYLAKINKNWADSPKNLAYWYTKDGLLYVVPNITAIMGQVSSDNGGESTGGVDLAALLEVLKQYNINIGDLLPAITEWMSTGIPLKYTASAGGVKVYVDKEMVAPFITALLPALTPLQKQIDEILADPEQMETGFMIQMVMAVFGIEKLTDIATVWNENTKEFEIALNLVK